MWDGAGCPGPHTEPARRAQTRGLRAHVSGAGRRRRRGRRTDSEDEATAATAATGRWTDQVSEELVKASHGGEAESGWPGLWRGGARWCWEPVGENTGWGDVTVTETEDALLAEPLPLAEGTRALEGHTEAESTEAGPGPAPPACSRSGTTTAAQPCPGEGARRPSPTPLQPPGRRETPPSHASSYRDQGHTSPWPLRGLQHR